MFARQRKQYQNEKYILLKYQKFLIDETDSKDPYTKGDYRYLQICSDCFENNDINKILAKENRQFKMKS